MSRNHGITALALFLCSCGGDTEPTEVAEVSYNIDQSRITVSGLSSGAMMAGQLHVSHSALFKGVGIFAGGPYYCAEASLSKGLGPCMKGGDLNVGGLIDYARAAAAAGTIDDLENLADDPVWIFLGSKDEVIHQDLAAGAIAFYSEFSAPQNIQYINDVPVVHGTPTLDHGAACDEFGSPFLNACSFDGAGEMLQALYGTMNDRSETTGDLIAVSQPGAARATMLDDAWLYVPESCVNGESCGLHVAIHGCKQSTDFVGSAFVTGAGYNEWAETNNLLVLYPQVDSSKLAPMNPMGCWDWWGYSNEDYATKKGPQTQVIKATIDMIAGKAL